MSLFDTLCTELRSILEARIGGPAVLVWTYDPYCYYDKPWMLSVRGHPYSWLSENGTSVMADAIRDLKQA